MKWKPKDIIEFVKSHPLLQQFVHWAKTTSFIGFRGASLFSVFSFFFNELRRDTVVVRASAISFNFILAFFPSLIFLFTLIPYLPLDNLEFQLYEFMRELLPAKAYHIIENTIRDLNRPREGLLSIGVLLTLYFSSNALMSLMRAFDKSHHDTFKRRNVFQLRWIALKLSFIITIFTIVGSVLLIGGNYMIEHVSQLSNVSEQLLTAAKWIILFLLIYCSITFIYRNGVSSESRTMPFFSPGCLVSTFLCILTSVIFSFYVNNFGQFNKIYGSIGTLIVIFIWIRLNSMLIIIGYELNVGILVNQKIETYDK